MTCSGRQKLIESDAVYYLADDFEGYIRNEFEFDTEHIAVRAGGHICEAQGGFDQ